MIRKFYSKREKKHWKYDAKKKLYWSYGFDIRLADGYRKREAGFMSEADAVAVVGRIRQTEKDLKYGFTPASSQPPLHELIERRLASIQNPQEKVRSTRIFGDLISLLPEGIKVTELKTTHLQLFVEKRLKDGVKPQSADRELHSIAACLNAARMLFPQLEQWTSPRIPHPKYSKGRRERVIRDEEKWRLLAYLLAPRGEGEREGEASARRAVGLIVQVALLTGLRHGEINRLRWDDLDLEAGSLKVVGTKTAAVTNPTRYITPLTASLLSILEERRRESKTAFIFTHSGGTLPKFYSILRKACAACRIPYGRKAEGGLTLHDARHTVTTRLLQAGVDPSTVQAITGHSDQQMVLYYSHATPESRRRAAAALEDYAGDTVPAEPRQDVPEFIN